MYHLGSSPMRLREAQQVVVELAGKPFALLLEQRVHVAQRGEVGLAHFQECLARRDFLAVQPDLARDRVHRLPFLPHACLHARACRTSLCIVASVLWNLMGKLPRRGVG